MRSFLISILVFSFTFQNFARATEGIPIRANIQKCQTLFVDKSSGNNDSNGTYFSDGKLSDFEQGLFRLREEGKLDSIRGSQFFVTGIAMGDENKLRSEYYGVLHNFGFGPQDVNVRVLSIPRAMAEKTVVPMVQNLMERLKYYFPSIARDFQKPLKGEVLFGAGVTGAIEFYSGKFLLTLPSPDAQITLLNHVLTLLSFVVFTRTITNWVIRSPSTTKSIFLNFVYAIPKQVALTSLFLLNFQLSGHLSQIMAYNAAHGAMATASQLPEQAKLFAISQGITFLAQTLFYDIVIAFGMERWANIQKTPDSSKKARTMVKLNEIFPLAIDAYILAKMGSGLSPTIGYLGALPVYQGHLQLLALTAAGSIFAFRPQILDPTLKIYDKTIDFFTLTKLWIEDTTGIKLSDLRQKIWPRKFSGSTRRGVESRQPPSES